MRIVEGCCCCVVGILVGVLKVTSRCLTLYLLPSNEVSPRTLGNPNSRKVQFYLQVGSVGCITTTTPINWVYKLAWQWHCSSIETHCQAVESSWWCGSRAIKLAKVATLPYV